MTASTANRTAGLYGLRREGWGYLGSPALDLLMPLLQLLCFLQMKPLEVVDFTLVTKVHLVLLHQKGGLQLVL